MKRLLNIFRCYLKRGVNNLRWAITEIRKDMICSLIESLLDDDNDSKIGYKRRVHRKYMDHFNENEIDYFNEKYKIKE